MATSRNVKGRLLKWGISYDKRVAQLKIPYAKLLYTWIIPSLDSLGRIEGEPRLIRTMIFPYEKITDKQVAQWSQDIHNNGLLFWYSVNGERYFQCPTTEKNIFFREGEGRNRRSDYPDPPKKEYKEWVDKTRLAVSRHVGVGLDLDLDLDLDSKQASPALTAAFTKVYNGEKGLNIYSLINKAKKLIGQPKEWQFPEDVLLRVCEAYEKDRANIKQPWPWFIKVLKAESALWHADQQIKLNDKRAGFAPSVKEILGIN